MRLSQFGCAIKERYSQQSSHGTEKQFVTGSILKCYCRKKGITYVYCWQKMHYIICNVIRVLLRLVIVCMVYGKGANAPSRCTFWCVCVVLCCSLGGGGGVGHMLSRLQLL